MTLLRHQFLSLLASTSTIAMSSSNATKAAPPDMPHVPWSRQAAIYQIDVRQYTSEGVLDVGNDKPFAFGRQFGVDTVSVVVNVTKAAQACRLGKDERSLPASGWRVEAA